ncbi:MAG TPA: hypothetical protein VG847_10710 [Chitinophagaceae bacterium]|nr:hypothetical protein [Chitinophagaceae bacterium]
MRIKFFLLSLALSLLGSGCSLQQGSKNEKIADEKIPAPKDPFQKLCQYWMVTDATSPTLKDIDENHTEGIHNIPGIVFMTDSVFLENPRSAMKYGHFIYKGKTINVQFDDGSKAIYTIDEIEGDTMVMRRTEDNHTTTLYVRGDRLFWPDMARNPYTKENSKWRFKPARPETPEQLKERLKECVQFYEYLFEANANSESTEVNFDGLPTCFKWYVGGILVQGPAHLDKKWINCFYSEEQAMQARQMMEDQLVNNKYNWDTTQTNWLKQTADVLKQIHDKM